MTSQMPLKNQMSQDYNASLRFDEKGGALQQHEAGRETA